MTHDHSRYDKLLGRVRDCKLGLTTAEVEQVIGADRMAAFNHWMRGQTRAICDGRSYDYSRQEYVPDCETAHGVVTYSHDVAQFLSGGGTFD